MSYYNIMSLIKNTTNNDDIYDLFNNSKDLLNKDHFTELINRNILIDDKLLNLDIYNINDYINDIKSLEEEQITNHLKNIIKYIKTEDEKDKLLLYINDNIKYYYKSNIMDYINNKEKQISYKEWMKKYPKLWVNLLHFNNIQLSIKKDIHLKIFSNIEILEYYDIEIDKYRNYILNYIDKIFNDYNINRGLNIDSINYLLSYTFKSNLYNKYNIILDGILKNIRYKGCIIYIIKNEFYDINNVNKIIEFYKKNDLNLNKILDYYKRNNLTLDSRFNIHQYDNKYFDFLFKYLFNIDDAIKNHINISSSINYTKDNICNIYCYTYLKFNHSSTNDNNKYIFLQYILKYIFINNIDFNFNDLDNNTIIYILDDYINNNEKLINSNIFNKLLTNCINDNKIKLTPNIYNIMKTIKNTPIFNINFNIISNIAFINIIKNIIIKNINYNNINILNFLDENIDYIDKNELNFNKKLNRYLDYNRNNIINKYKNLEKELSNYNLKISFISKLYNKNINKLNIGYDISKLIYDYI